MRTHASSLVQLLLLWQTATLLNSKHAFVLQNSFDAITIVAQIRRHATAIAECWGWSLLPDYFPIENLIEGILH